MSASGPISPQKLLDQAKKIDSVQGALLAGITTIILAVSTGATNFINAVSNLFSAPIFELGTQGANVVTAFVGGIAGVINAGAVQTADALGASPLVVPLLAFIYAVLVAGGAAFAMAFVLSRATTGDTVLGIPVDFPFFGADETDE